MLSSNAFNALLKILEEPPEHVLFLFSTTNPEKLPATILSRCQRFDFRAVPTERIAEHLANICKQEKVKADAEALLAIAREGRGSVRDALTLLDQAIAVGGGKVTIEAVRDSVGAVSGDQVLALLSACGDGDAGAALRKFADLLAGGADVLALLDQCIRLVRDLLVVKTCGSDVELVDVFGPDPKALAAEAKKLSVPALVTAMGYLVEARSRARWSADGRPVAELAVVRLASLAEMEPLPEVLARLDRLQQSLSGGSTRPLDRARGRPVFDPEAQTRREPVEGRPAPQPMAGEKKKHDLNENEGRVPGEAEPSDAPPEVEAARLDPGAEAPDGQPPLPREPAKRRKLDDAMMDPLIQKAIRLFDGRIVNIED